MLQRKVLEPDTLELLKALQEKEYLQEFSLVGGTGLALYMGHRKSIDLDLFTTGDIDTSSLIESIRQDFPFQLDQVNKNTVKGSIRGIKVDFIAHRYPLLQKPMSEDGFRLLSIADIAAMKMNAIITSGQRVKDFIDVYFLLEEKICSIADFLQYYHTKYQQSNDMLVLKSLVYFGDVDLADWPVLIKKPNLTWETVRKTIEKAVLQYLNQR
ncbi:MAG: nucleotidyl transferase AbiEii/AbiGii toxin family protein [Bacteroidales bacterium]